METGSPTTKDETRHKLGVFPEWERMENVDDMDADELDELPFGAIQLDPSGKVLSYNSTESEISGREPSEVLGKDFFEEVAPCTNVQQFAGKFRRGVEDGTLNAVFPYLFDFEMEPTRVWVRLFYSDRTNSAWVFVTRQNDGDESKTTGRS